jgi:hypothetical protein
MTPRGLLTRAAAFLLCHLLALGILLLGAVSWVYRLELFGLDRGPGPADRRADRKRQVAPPAPSVPGTAEQAAVAPDRPTSQVLLPPVFRPLEPTIPPQPENVPPARAADAALTPSATAELSGLPALQPAPLHPEGGALPEALPLPAGRGSGLPAPDTPPPTPHAGPVADQASRDTLLNAARAAGAASDFATAERHYRELWERFPDDPDAAGELADFYRRQGKTAEAEAAYLEAARRLVRAGQATRAQALAARLQAWSPQTAGIIYALVPPPTWPGGQSQSAPSLYRSLGR